MSEETILVLAAPEGPGIAPETELLGLPLVRRTALAAHRAGLHASSSSMLRRRCARPSRARTPRPWPRRRREPGALPGTSSST